MRILFLGAGALGGYFGGRMTAGGADVTLLVRPARQAALAEGLVIESPLGDARIPLKTITTADSADPFDLIVLTNKAYGLAGALDAISPFIGPETAILPLLNGLAHYQTIEARFPDTPVLGGVAHIPAEMRPDGSILHRGKLARLTVGLRRDHARSAEIASGFVAATEAGGVQARVSETIEKDLWDKWVFLCALAAGTCLMRADVGAICRTADGASVMTRLIAECSAVAHAEGHAPDSKQRGFYRDQLTSPEGRFKASMLTDLEAGNPTEADHIIGDMIARGRAHGVQTPTLETALSHLHVYESARI